jgi:transposase-like protein
VGGTGRPPVYNARIPNIVRGFRERGATEHEIADILGISDRTLRQWRAQHIEFSAALNVSNEAMVKRAFAAQPKLC